MSMRNAQSFIAWFVNFFLPFDEQILVVGRLKAEFSRIYFCDGQILKITERNDYEIIHVKCTFLLNEKLNSFQLSYSLVHVKTCINSYVTRSWFYLTFLSLLNSCLTVTVTYIRNRKRAFTIEPISLIFAKFNFAIKDQNLANKFRGNLSCENFCSRIFSSSISVIISSCVRIGKVFVTWFETN